MILLRQLVRYGVVGIASNGVLYLLYLLLTQQGMGHKLAMSTVFVIGVLQTFVFNRRWTFEHGGGIGGPFARYAASYAIAYGANLAALAVLVDGAGLPHQGVQAAMILCNAALLFLLQKYWVFRTVPVAASAAPID